MVRTRGKPDLRRQGQLEPGETLELSLGGPAGLRIILALAFLAEKMRLDLGHRRSRNGLAAALLDEGAPDRRLALGRGEIDAIPAVAAIAGGEKVAQQIGLVAVARGIARIADDAQACEH